MLPPATSGSTRFYRKILSLKIQNEEKYKKITGTLGKRKAPPHPLTGECAADPGQRQAKSNHCYSYWHGNWLESGLALLVLVRS
jgi:hypothetical protein